MSILTAPRILCVDDVREMRQALIKVLRKLGYKYFLEAENGAAALRLLRTKKVSLVILDWNMPKMSGLELLGEIRSDPKLRHLPVLMVTGDSTEEGVLEAIEAGVNDYMVKPFTPEILKEKLDVIFDGFHALH